MQRSPGNAVLHGAALVERLLAVPFAERDAWLDALLGFESPPPDLPDLPRGVVPYLPCGVDEILAMVREAPVGADDLLVDVGSGLGRMLILAHLISGAKAHGIEIQEPLVAAARAHCAALGIGQITFAHANAADIALDGSRFFLYAPCNGALLARVLERIGEVARLRPIVVGTVGFELHDVAWLAPRASSCPALMLYDSRAF
jgi:SAM-dependent methyltransferase